MTWNSELLTFCTLSVLVGIFITQWYLTIAIPEEVMTGDHSLSLLKYSSLVKVAKGDGTVLGTIDLGNSTSATHIAKFNNKCISVSWRSTSGILSCSKARHVISGGHWYGGPQYYTARWPVDKEDIQAQPYLSDDLLAKPTMFGSILERYWLSSKNIAIYIPDDEIDFEYGVVDGDIVFQSSSQLIYVVCHGSHSPKDTHMYMVDNFFAKPSGLPDRGMFQYPIWSTWARYKIYINESIVLSFADEIKSNKFPASQIEIDDTYTTNYGDHIFDSKRFPNPADMISNLKASGFRVTAWVHPFVNFNSQSFQEGSASSYFLSTRKHNVPGLVRWWQGVGAMINVNRDKAVEWYVSKLDKLRDLGIDSFKFDAGEACYMPTDLAENPNLITQRYVQVVSQFGGMVETRAAYRNQGSPTFLRMMDKHSYWGFNNGLKTMIPSALHLSIIGYHFILPDMIGGNAMGPDEDWYAGELPKKELYIRWFQLVTFLQSMQISISPWQYDKETTDLARDLVKLHAEYVAPRVISLAEETVRTGAPIIRPMWWVAPEEQVAYQIEDQFLIGDDVLVAPVVEEEVRSRFIYIPPGTWKDMTISQTFTGPDWINYPVNLHTIPYFERVQ